MIFRVRGYCGNTIAHLNTISNIDLLAQISIMNAGSATIRLNLNVLLLERPVNSMRRIRLRVEWETSIPLFMILTIMEPLRIYRLATTKTIGLTNRGRCVTSGWVRWTYSGTGTVTLRK